MDFNLDCVYTHLCDGHATPAGLDADLVRAVEGAASWEYGYGLAYRNGTGLRANVGLLLADVVAALATALPAVAGPSSPGPAKARLSQSDFRRRAPTPQAPEASQASRVSQVDAVVATKAVVADPTPLRFVLFSGHDTGPVGPLLQALGLFPWADPTQADSWPAYASLLALEAWAPPSAVGPSSGPSGDADASDADPTDLSGDGAFVRLVFQGSPVALPGCALTADGLCPLGTFLDFAAALVPTEEDCAGGAPAAGDRRAQRGRRRGPAPYAPWYVATS